MIHLDTNFLIAAAAHGTSEDALMLTWLNAGQPIGVSTPAWAEFLCGPVSAAAVEFILSVIHNPVPFDRSEAELAARLFNELGRRRGSLIDCMIAATAMHAGARLATANARDFRRFEPLGLQLAVTR
ncbi:MAG: type II toxin-antitoxin system VapC family toxin [Gemmatimonadaceae bacterium]